MYYSDSEDEIDEYDNELDEMYENLYNNNVNFIEADKKHHHYYLGICKYIPHEDYYLSLNSVSAKMFFEYPYDVIIKFLQLFSCIYVHSPKIEIMKLEIVDDVYTVVKKTFWLRIVQRTWKRIFRERQNILMRRASIANVFKFEQRGRYSSGLNSLPTLHNMIRH
jgi:hypothetical protein